MVLTLWRKFINSSNERYHGFAVDYDVIPNKRVQYSSNQFHIFSYYSATDEVNILNILH